MADEIDSGMTVGLEEEIMAELTEEFKIVVPKYSPTLLLIKLRSAMRTVRLARRYFNNPEYFNTEERIEEDMREYYENIRSLAVIRYNKIGAEGEKSHSENSVSITFQTEEECLARVLPISGVH